MIPRKNALCFPSLLDDEESECITQDHRQKLLKESKTFALWARASTFLRVFYVRI